MQLTVIKMPFLFLLISSDSLIFHSLAFCLWHSMQFPHFIVTGKQESAEMKIELKEITVRDLTNGYEDNQENGVIGYGGKLDIRPPSLS